MTYDIYTDGAYSSKRNQGGIGIVILKNNEVIQKFYKDYHNTTNNQMEIIAVMYALSSVKQPIDILNIYTDSMYVIGCATMGWKRKKNIKLWLKFDEILAKTSKLVNRVVFHHVKGHEGNKYNEICDSLAVMASKL